jgi:hypothetical protein
MPRGLASAVRSILNLHQEPAWYSLRPGRERPLDFLFAYFDPELRGDSVRSASTLAGSEQFKEKVIWLDGITGQEWELWKEFFSDYGQACQHFPVGRRTVFCVPLSGTLATPAMFRDPLWSQYLWRGVVSSLDMLLFTSSMLQERSITPLQKRVAISVIAKLALWDPEICERLVMAELEEMLNPMRILREVASERKWGPELYGTNLLSWEKGMKDQVDRRWMTHSSILAFETSHKEVNRRIWNAEMSVLLPMVEEGRQNIIETYGENLQIPWQANKHKAIYDLYDLEINHIKNQIHRHVATLDVATQRLVHELTEIRNCLSHLKTISMEMLESEILNHSIESQLEREMSFFLQDAGEEPL